MIFMTTAFVYVWYYASAWFPILFPYFHKKAATFFMAAPLLTNLGICGVCGGDTNIS